MSLIRCGNAQWDLKGIFTIAAAMTQANTNFTNAQTLKVSLGRLSVEFLSQPTVLDFGNVTLLTSHINKKKILVKKKKLMKIK